MAMAQIGHQLCPYDVDSVNRLGQMADEAGGANAWANDQWLLMLPMVRTTSKVTNG